MIADANGCFVQAVKGQVFAEHASGDLPPIKLRSPSRKVIGRVGKNRFIDSPVMNSVGLPITIDAGRSNLEPTLGRFFVYRGGPS